LIDDVVKGNYLWFFAKAFQIVHRKGQSACSVVKNVTKITLMRSGSLKSDDTSHTRLVTTN
jgi:hypothetical protein